MLFRKSVREDSLWESETLQSLSGWVRNNLFRVERPSRNIREYTSSSLIQIISQRFSFHVFQWRHLQPPLFNGCSQKRKTTPRGRAWRFFECLGRTYFIRVHQIISVSAPIAKETAFVCAYLRIFIFLPAKMSARAVSSQPFIPSP